MHAGRTVSADASRRSAARRLEQRMAMVIVLVPCLGTLMASVLVWQHGWRFLDLGLCVAMYTLTALGVTAGFHRLFTHGSFQTRRWIAATLAVLGSMSAQGPLLFWVAAHRRHHHYSDQEGDPHSPHYGYGTTYWARLRGLWHAHMGWMFRHAQDDWGRYVPDLLRDPLLFTISQYYFVWALLGIVAPALLGGLLQQSWQGMAYGALWGGLVRMFLLHHVTWSINSICHVYGRRPYQVRDASTNHLGCALLSLGEGWHNNHHAFPSSARHGLRWWELDVTYLVIWLLQRLGLAWNVKVPVLEHRKKAA